MDQHTDSQVAVVLVEGNKIHRHDGDQTKDWMRRDRRPAAWTSCLEAAPTSKDLLRSVPQDGWPQPEEQLRYREVETIGARSHRGDRDANAVFRGIAAASKSGEQLQLRRRGDHNTIAVLFRGRLGGEVIRNTALISVTSAKLRNRAGIIIITTYILRSIPVSEIRLDNGLSAGFGAWLAQEGPCPAPINT